MMNGQSQCESAATGISDSKTKREPFPGVFRECARGLREADTADWERVNYYRVTFEIRECYIGYKNEHNGLDLFNK